MSVVFPQYLDAGGEEIVISNVKITLIESGDFVDVFKVKSAK